LLCRLLQLAESFNYSNRNYSNRALIIELAARHRLPTIYGIPGTAAEGALLPGKLWPWLQTTSGPSEWEYVKQRVPIDLDREEAIDFDLGRDDCLADIEMIVANMLVEPHYVAAKSWPPAANTLGDRGESGEEPGDVIGGLAH
jgi:hypothetical protein